MILGEGGGGNQRLTLLSHYVHVEQSSLFCIAEAGREEHVDVCIGNITVLEAEACIIYGRNLNVYMYTCIHHTLHTKHTPRHKAQYELNPSLIQLGVITSHNGKQKL